MKRKFYIIEQYSCSVLDKQSTESRFSVFYINKGRKIRIVSFAGRYFGITTLNSAIICRDEIYTESKNVIHE
ncbi:MAG: hypothetical protein D6711_10175 [Chloroflexi bacterium]|nr:MAG: hypothetical protein D6711_10175 [Chloroflexota bacterium]